MMTDTDYRDTPPQKSSNDYAELSTSDTPPREECDLHAGCTDTASPDAMSEEDVSDNLCQPPKPAPEYPVYAVELTDENLRDLRQIAREAAAEHLKSTCPDLHEISQLSDRVKSLEARIVEIQSTLQNLTPALTNLQTDINRLIGLIKKSTPRIAESARTSNNRPEQIYAEKYCSQAKQTAGNAAPRLLNSFFKTIAVAFIADPEDDHTARVKPPATKNTGFSLISYASETQKTQRNQPSVSTTLSAGTEDAPTAHPRKPGHPNAPVPGEYIPKYTTPTDINSLWDKEKLSEYFKETASVSVREKLAAETAETITEEDTSASNKCTPKNAESEGVFPIPENVKEPPSLPNSSAQCLTAEIATDDADIPETAIGAMSSDSGPDTDKDPDCNNGDAPAAPENNISSDSKVFTETLKLSNTTKDSVNSPVLDEKPNEYSDSPKKKSYTETETPEPISAETPVPWAFPEYRLGNVILLTDNEFSKRKRKIFLIGDLHSDDVALRRILHTVLSAEPSAIIVFMGDIFDRGNDHLKTARRFIETARQYSGQFLWLQGNHDIALSYDEVSGQFKSDVDPAEFAFWLNTEATEDEKKEARNLIKIIADLPVVAIFGDTWVSHGGIPHERLANTFTDFSSMSREIQIACIWNRAADCRKKLENKSHRGSDVGFAQAEYFFGILKQKDDITIRHLICAHQHNVVQGRGYRPLKRYYTRKLAGHTLFSCTKNENGEVIPCIMELLPGEEPRVFAITDCEPKEE